jgi:transposase
MDREALEALDKAALVELVVQLHARLAEQEARLAGLEAELTRLRRPPKTPDNSSVPPSQGFKPNRAERRRAKRGARRGHLGISRRRQVPDVVVRCRPTACRGCGAALPATNQRRVGRSQVIELPPVRPLVIEAWRYAAVCAGCGERTVADAPPGLEAERTFGPGVETLLGYLHERHHLGYERLVEVFRDLFGLALSEGAVAGALARLAERARPTYEAIGAAVRASPEIGSDETSARVNGKNWWQWVYQTPTASYHEIVPSRGAAVIDAFRRGAEPEVWSSDLWAPQIGTAAGVHQVCLGHQIRDLTYAVEADDLDGRLWAVALRHLFGRAIRLHAERAGLSPEQFARRRTRVIKAAERLVFGPPLGVGVAWKLQRRYRQHWDAVFVFLERAGVEPTNNASERDLRNSVIHRKVTGGYRSAWGAEASAILTTILTTARKRGDNLWAALRTIAGPSPLEAAGMAR